MRKTALRRKTPLRAKTGLTTKTPLRASAGQIAKVYRVPARMIRKNPRRGKWAAWREQEHDAVTARSPFCEVPTCTGRGVHVHHVFGRLDEPWGSSRLCCLHICLIHHQSAHADPMFRDALRKLVLIGLTEYVGRQMLAKQMTGAPRHDFNVVLDAAKEHEVVPPGLDGEAPIQAFLGFPIR